MRLFSTSALILLLFSILLSCGIKSKPLPPIQAPTQESDPSTTTEKKK